MRIGSLCSGAGGLAVESVFGAKTAWHCELDPAASKVLAHRWPGVPNYGDLANVTWGIWKEHSVDIICAGWPCQPFSLAGRQKGAADERAIWPQIARCIRILRPRYVVLENVSAVLRSEFSRVADSLAALGYDLSWTCARASDVGAPHRRERLFVVAYLADTPRNGRHEGRPESARFVGGSSDAAERGHGAVDLLPTPKASDGQRGDSPSERERNDPSIVAIDYYAPNGQWGKYAPAIARWEAVTRPAPAPTEPNKNGNPRLSAAFSEWLMGWPAGWVTDVPGISRNDALRIVGNGVVDRCAEAALRHLLSVAREVVA